MNIIQYLIKHPIRCACVCGEDNCISLDVHLEDTDDSILLPDYVSSLDDLRWIANEFIYFLDIPWSVNATSDAAALDIHEPISHDNTFFIPLPHDDIRIIHRLQSAVTEALEGLLGDMVLNDCAESCGSSQESQTFLSGEALLRLLVPWGRHLLNSNPATLRQHMERFRFSLERAVSILDQVVLEAPNVAVLSDLHEDSLFLGAGSLLFSLSRWAWSLGFREFAQVVGNSRVHVELLMFYKRVLAARWNSDPDAETERIYGGGIPFLAYAIQSRPTVNRSKEVTDFNNYIPLHIEPACQCPATRPPLSDVVKFLSQGRIPVIFVDGDHVGIRDASDGPYIAISHVWADGLGSTTEDGIPACQISLITRLAHTLIPGCAFWLDALCIPARKESRVRAIALMAQTYEQANKVLVIDGGVRTQCSVSSPKEECILRTATSGWMQRIWTLQEGLLAQNLHFELADGIIDCTHFNGAPYVLAQELIPLIRKFCSPMPESDEYIPAAPTTPLRCTYGELIPFLRHRRTSKPEDETLAIAGILGVNASELLAESSRKDRMRKLLLLCGTIPRHIAVAGWSAQKLTTQGFSWAPLSITEISWWGNLIDPFGPARCTEDGLYGRYTVIHFDKAISITSPWAPLGVITTVVRDLVDTSEKDANANIAGVHIGLSEHTLAQIFGGDISFSFNAVIMLHEDIVATQAGEISVALVSIDSDSLRMCDCRQRERLRCKFVSTGNLFVDTHSASLLKGRGWEFVDSARMHSLLPILLT